VQDAWFLRDDESTSPGTRIALRIRRAENLQSRSAHDGAAARERAATG
jgi:hypothetical protein